jgi:hypothetical protein
MRIHIQKAIFFLRFFSQKNINHDQIAQIISQALLSAVASDAFKY